MRIVIAGAGMVGFGLARRLAQGKHDVVVVDAKRETCERVYSELGVTTICGSATSIGILEQAELREADCAAASMRLDSDNLCFALLARNMGVRKIIVRMRDPRYEDAYRLAGATRILNIVGLYLNQFVWEIEEPQVQEITSIGGGKASIVFVQVPQGSRVAGKTIQEMTRSPEFPGDCLIVGIHRADSGEFIVPRGGAVVRAGDRVYLAAQTEAVRRATRYMGAK